MTGMIASELLAASAGEHSEACWPILQSPTPKGAHDCCPVTPLNTPPALGSCAVAGEAAGIDPAAAAAVASAMGAAGLPPGLAGLLIHSLRQRRGQGGRARIGVRDAELEPRAAARALANRLAAGRSKFFKRVGDEVGILWGWTHRSSRIYLGLGKWSWSVGGECLRKGWYPQNLHCTSPSVHATVKQILTHLFDWLQIKRMRDLARSARILPHEAWRKVCLNLSVVR